MLIRTFLLFILVILNLSWANTHTDCQSLFNHIVNSKVTEKLPVVLKNLPPEQTILKLDKDLGDRIFLKIREQFLTKMEGNIGDLDFMDALSKIKKGKLVDKMQNSEQRYQEILIEMKAKRKYAAILRSVFIVFSKDHESPKNFENFTKVFGKFNDTLDFKAWNSMPLAAKKLEDAYDIKKIIKELDRFKNSKQSDVIKNLDEIKMEILDLLEKDELTVSEFHETRKLMKHYLTTIQMIVQVDDNKELLPAFNFLNELNDTLGGLRDDVLKDEVLAANAGMKSKVDDKEIIPSTLKSNMRTFLNGLVIED